MASNRRCRRRRHHDRAVLFDGALIAGRHALGAHTARRRRDHRAGRDARRGARSPSSAASPDRVAVGIPGRIDIARGIVERGGQPRASPSRSRCGDRLRDRARRPRAPRERRQRRGPRCLRPLRTRPAGVARLCQRRHRHRRRLRPRWAAPARRHRRGGGDRPHPDASRRTTLPVRSGRLRRGRRFGTRGGGGRQSRGCLRRGRLGRATVRDDPRRRRRGRRRRDDEHRTSRSCWASTRRWPRARRPRRCSRRPASLVASAWRRSTSPWAVSAPSSPHATGDRDVSAQPLVITGGAVVTPSAVIEPGHVVVDGAAGSSPSARPCWRRAGRRRRDRRHRLLGDARVHRRADQRRARHRPHDRAGPGRRARRGTSLATA